MTVNDLRKIAVTDPDDEVGFNDPVIRLFDAGFATTQATTIRRLIERPHKKPQRAVISLRRVLEDIRKNLDLITRENYVCYNGLPYAYELVEQKWRSSLPVGIHAGSLPAQGPDDWITAEIVHKNFDILPQVHPEKRSREDHIKIEILENLEAEIKKCENVKTYVHKFIAMLPHRKQELAFPSKRKA